jgi:hypothetical protein
MQYSVLRRYFKICSRKGFLSLVCMVQESGRWCIRSSYGYGVHQRQVTA